MPAQSYEQALNSVKFALDRIHRTSAYYQYVEADHKASVDIRELARRSASGAIQEFVFQWENVDIILREKNL